MGTLTLYAIKSAVTLALLYLPYTLLMRRDTFFRFNRLALLAIVALSLIVPCLDLHLWDNTSIAALEVQRQAIASVTLPTLVVGATLPDMQTGTQSLLWPTLFVYIYIIGVVLCLVWKLVGLIRLLHFIPSGCLWVDKHEDATIYCHAGQVAPFSWMHAIVIGENEAHDESPVLLHESAHIRFGHSWDTLFISLVEVLQWFNPMIWMLDASLREVHEYEADDAVLRRGISARDYQLLLIEKAVAGTRYPMANAFNHSLLKNRITMMTKQKSPRWARLKVLYAVPLTLVAIGVMASPQITEKVEKSIAPKAATTPNVERVDEKQALRIKPGSLRLVVDGKEMTVEEAMVAVKGKTIKNDLTAENELRITTASSSQKSLPDDKEVCEKPEVMPEFPGGTNELFGWLSKNVRYPEAALEWGVQGRVLVQFVVEKDGSVSEPKILKVSNQGKENEIVVTAYKAKDDTSEEQRKEGESLGQKALQDEAIRVVKAMPKWTPGKHKGKDVRTKFTLPIMFRLN